MRFLLKLAFWLTVVVVLMPSDRAQQGAPSPQVGAGEAVSATGAVVADMRQFCVRQPDACAVGSQVATAIGYKAQANAKMLYNFLSEALAPRETGSLASGTLRTGGSIKATAEPSPPEQASQSTLTRSDLAPAWRGPAPHRDGKPSA